GLQLFVVIYSLCVYFETPVAYRKGRGPYIATSCILSGLYMLRTAVYMPLIFSALFKAKSARDFMSPNHWMGYQNGWEAYTAEFSFTLMVALADGLLLYRCYIVLYGSRWLLVLPGLTYLGTIGMSAGDIMNIINYLGTSAAFSLPVGGVWTGLNVATNVMITGLLSYRLKKAQNALSATMPSQGRTPLFVGAASLLIESTAPLTFFGICYAAIAFAEIPPSVPLDSHIRILSAGKVLHELYCGFIVLSPQIIVLRVTTGRSWMKSPNSTGNDVGLSRSLAFAQAPIEQSHITGMQDGLEGQATSSIDGTGSYSKDAKGL
ncbi:hypothetical protein FA15DRAFT_594103, partial [Coprinopsis marcescibilis]